MTEQPPLAAPEPTGNDEVDAALGRLADLDDADLADHHERLSAAHEALHGVLDEATDPPR